MESIGEAKVAIRAESIQRFKALKQFEIQKSQNDFDINLSSFLKDKVGYWSAYRSISGEVSPKVSIDKNHQIRWVYPKTNGNSLQFYLEPKSWIKGSFGVEEPDPSNNVLFPLSDLKACLVPGLAFDRNGTRVGRGLGYFDRALESYKGLKVGLGFDFQFFQETTLPKEEFDVSMDVIITNKDVFILNPGFYFNFKSKINDNSNIDSSSNNNLNSNNNNPNGEFGDNLNPLVDSNLTQVIEGVRRND